MTSWMEVHATPFGGDLHFHYMIEGELVRIAVTHSCLRDVFGSDGSDHGDQDALQFNVVEILFMAISKSHATTQRPIVLTAADFEVRHQHRRSRLG
ncbi:hypothetical protein [Caballeronia sp. LZ043]|uniref:hypothetical protein n=1 Tax=Caballeronia sp. LZ043 TaxID=3038569 RepID=UPI00286221FC|nr:hypothetical protein [Caballeronia sp. LZ043]MDR5821959.1 hypothetical protein [Caballeronia sp. LZ043]